MKRRWILAALLLVLIIASAWTYFHFTAPPMLHSDVRLSTNPIDSADAQTRQKLLGTWTDDYEGKRTMTLLADGTGTMLVELSGVKATLFAKQLRFDMRWTIEGKKFTKQTIGGEPANKVNLIINTMGDTAEDTIVELTEDRLLLLDKNGKTQYDWRRLSEKQ